MSSHLHALAAWFRDDTAPGQSILRRLDGAWAGLLSSALVAEHLGGITLADPAFRKRTRLK